MSGSGLAAGCESGLAAGSGLAGFGLALVSVAGFGAVFVIGSVGWWGFPVVGPGEACSGVTGMWFGSLTVVFGAGLGVESMPLTLADVGGGTGLGCGVVAGSAEAGESGFVLGFGLVLGLAEPVVVAVEPGARTESAEGFAAVMFGLGESVPFGPCAGVGEAVPFKPGDGFGEVVMLGLGDGVWEVVMLGLGDGVWEVVMLGLGDGVWEAVILGLGDGFGEGVPFEPCAGVDGALVAGAGLVRSGELGAVSGPERVVGLEETFAWLGSVAECGAAVWRPPKPGRPVSCCGVGESLPLVAGGETVRPPDGAWPFVLAGGFPVVDEPGVGGGVASRDPAWSGAAGGGVGDPVLTESDVDGGGAAWWSVPFAPWLVEAEVEPRGGLAPVLGDGAVLLPGFGWGLAPGFVFWFPTVVPGTMLGLLFGLRLWTPDGPVVRPPWFSTPGLVPGGVVLWFMPPGEVVSPVGLLPGEVVSPVGLLPGVAVGPVELLPGEAVSPVGLLLGEWGL
ncbi:hypothetical protein [Amycolatopsis echigonensis]|uniref:hypothetical protein n=1 Tax=Amycolatopsis echigonensis TaxID=2576905 RepID=UPI001C7F5032|nr:hypothetical protein [Amycolatopsis echigonensis]